MPVNPISQASIARAKKSDPNAGRCLVSDTDGAEVAHVAPRELTKVLYLMNSLEWVWKMRQGSLNLDTRRNIIFLSPCLHDLYQARKWALLPEEAIIDQFFDNSYDQRWPAVPLSREDFPEITGDTFHYTFLPLDNLSGVAILRQHRSASGHAEGNSIHEHPFTTLPTFLSHIHPTFALTHLINSLSQLHANPFGQDLLRTNQVVSKVNRLRTVWMSDNIPPYSQTDASFVNRQSDWHGGSRELDDRESVATRPRRVPYPPSECTKPPVKWRRVADSSGSDRWEKDNYCLQEDEYWVESEIQSEEKESLEQMIMGDVSEGSWTKETILEWARACEPTTSESDWYMKDV